jgi:hypothetical protein
MWLIGSTTSYVFHKAAQPKRENIQKSVRLIVL